MGRLLETGRILFGDSSLVKIRFLQQIRIIIHHMMNPASHFEILFLGLAVLVKSFGLEFAFRTILGFHLSCFFIWVKPKSRHKDLSGFFRHRTGQGEG